MPEKLAGKFGQLERLQQPFFRRHPAKRLNVYLVIGTVFDVHKIIPVWLMSLFNGGEDVENSLYI